MEAENQVKESGLDLEGEKAFGESHTEAGKTAPSVTEPPKEIFVDVCGAVAEPGVYKMPPDSRVFQAVEAAGGFREEAAETCINQAQPLCDGQQIYIPTKEEAEISGLKPEGTAQKAPETGTLPEGTASAEENPVNLNTADSETLQTLSGIGEAKAQAIVAYREEHGGFSSVEELMQVPGIKESTFLKIKDKIAVE